MRSSANPKNPLKIAGLLFMIAAGLAAVLWTITSRDGLKAAQQQAKAAGIPTTSAELNPKPGAPAEENAADLLLSYDLEIVSNQSWAKASPADKERMMAPADAKLDALRAVLDKTYLDFNRDWTQHMESLFHEGPVIKSLIKDLTERAKLHAQQGRTSEALKDLEVAQHITHLVHDDVGLIGHLVAVAIHRIKDVAFMDVATTLRSKGQSVEGLQRLLDREIFPSLARAVKTEAYLISFTECLRPAAGGGVGFEDFRRIYLLEAIKDLESLTKNPDDVLKAAKEIDARFARATEGSIFRLATCCIATRVRPSMILPEQASAVWQVGGWRGHTLISWRSEPKRDDSPMTSPSLGGIAPIPSPANPWATPDLKEDSRSGRWTATAWTTRA